MLFVDGENFAYRAAKVAEKSAVTLTEGPYYQKRVFVWMPGLSANRTLYQPQKGHRLEEFAVRAHYYTSLIGSDEKISEVKRALRGIGFQPQVFKRPATQRQSKCVDISLTSDLLVNAFHGTYDVAVLIAGDGDYVPAIEEVQRIGRLVYVAFFDGAQSGLNKHLRLRCDKFFPLSEKFVASWSSHDVKRGLSKPIQGT